MLGMYKGSSVLQYSFRAELQSKMDMEGRVRNDVNWSFSVSRIYIFHLAFLRPLSSIMGGICSVVIHDQPDHWITDGVSVGWSGSGPIMIL